MKLTGKFRRDGQRLTALELVGAENAEAWNEWRQSIDIFGDHLRTRVNLAEVDSPGANLSGFNFTNVSFYRANLRSARLRGVDCAFADFHEANLIGADLSNASFRNARLSRAYLRNANLDHADLRGVDFRRASLTATSLVGADIRGVDLSSTRGLLQDQLEDALGDANTRLPPHLARPSSWVEYDREDEDDEEDLEKLRTLPASVEVAVIAGTVQLTDRPGDAAFSSSQNASVLRREILEGLANISPRCGNIPELKRSIEAYIEELLSENYDVIIVGVRAIKMQSVFEAVIKGDSSDNPELLPDVVGSLRATIIQHYLFISQSHRWKAFLEEAQLSPFGSVDREGALESGGEISDVLREHSDVVDSRVPTALERVTEEVQITDDNQKLAVFNLFASIENLLKGLISWAVREARRFLGTTWGEFSKELSRIVGKSMARLLVAAFTSHVVAWLAATYPERFAWLSHAVALLTTSEKEGEE